MTQYTTEYLSEEVNGYEQDIIERIVPDQQNSKKGVIETTILSKKYSISVEIPDAFPHQLPVFRVNDEELRKLPHVLFTDGVCYIDSDALFIDTTDPVSVFINAFDRVRFVLEEGLSGTNKSDYFNEFEVYWARHSLSYHSVQADINVKNSEIRCLDIAIEDVQTSNPNIDAKRIFAVEIDAAGEQIEKIFKTKIKKRSKGLYIPLSRQILPPIDKTWAYEDLVSNVMKALKPKQKEKLRIASSEAMKEVKPNGAHLDVIVFSMPIEENNLTFFACWIGGYHHSKKVKGEDQFIHSLYKKPGKHIFRTLSAYRWDRDYLIKRTGGNTEMKRKKVLVVGAGSIGSEIIMKMCKAGIGALTIVDDDYLSRDNIHRHAMGFNKLIDKTSPFTDSKFKVKVIEEEILEKYPYTAVEAVPKSFEEYIILSQPDLKENDLIIFALGDPNIELQFANLLRKEESLVPHIHTWLEPLGIGGHVLISGNGKNPGCFNCLYRNISGIRRNDFGFAMPDQDFSRKVSGCGTTFRPYSFLDSEKTAALAVEAAIKVMTGVIRENPLLSWKGDGEGFFAEGYKTTPRYKRSQEELNEHSLEHINNECEICSC